MARTLLLTTLLVAIALGAEARTQGRWLLAPAPGPSANNCSTNNPSGCRKAGIPPECYGTLFNGNQWEHDEIECHVCDNSKQLKCDLDTDLIGDDSVKCEFDDAGVSAATSNAYEFDCEVDSSKDPQNQCNWAELEQKLPGCALEPVRRIMASWNATESSWADWWFAPTYFGTPSGTCSTQNPAGCIETDVPEECSGNLFSGNQWQGDELECHVCNNDLQLKCDLDTDLIGDNSVKCELDNAGAGSLVNNAYEFECVVDTSKSPQNQCDWAELESSLPGCALEPVRRIMATWNPVE